MFKIKAVGRTLLLFITALFVMLSVFALIDGTHGVYAEEYEPEKDYGYYSMTKGMRDLYDDMVEDIENMLVIGEDITSPVSVSQSVSYRPLNGMVYKKADYGLTYEQMTSVFSVLRLLHPDYYFLPGLILHDVGNTQIQLVIDDDFASAEQRDRMDNLIERTKADILTDIPDEASVYEKVLAIHDRIIDQLEYAYDESGAPAKEHFAHSIIGAVTDKKSGTCETYSDWFSYLMLDMGIENYIVTGQSRGQNHAWNIVRMDDGKWYDFDLTWDDSSTYESRWGKYYGYFASPASEFDADHIKKAEDSYGIDYLYRIPEAEDSFDFNYYAREGMMVSCESREAFAEGYAKLFEHAIDNGVGKLILYAGSDADFAFIKEEYAKLDLVKEIMKDDGYPDIIGVSSAVFVNDRLICVYITDPSFCEKSPTAKHVFSGEVIDDKYLIEPATCCSRAVYLHACLYCGAKGGDSFEYGGYSDSHKLSRTEASAADCKNEGNIEYWYCSVCRKYFDSKSAGHEITYTETLIPKTGHSYGAYKNDGETHIRVCTVCGDTERGAHVYDKGNAVREPTPESDGEILYVCTLCQAEKREPLPYGGHTHSFSGWKYDEENHWKECSCGEVNDKGAHEFAEDTFAYIPPTHSSDGKRVYRCKVCGFSYEETLLSSPEHQFGDWTENDGDTHKKVCWCGYTVTEKHSYDGGAITVAPTPQSTGVKTYTCVVCGYTYTETVPTSGHVHEYLPDYKYDASSHWRECSCGDKTDISEHTFETEVAKAPTHTESGSAIKRCPVCGYTGESVLPPTAEHNFGEWQKYDSKTHYRTCECGERETGEHDYKISTVITRDNIRTVTYVCSECGDIRREQESVGNSDSKRALTVVGFSIAALAAAGAAVGVIFILRRTKKKSGKKAPGKNRKE